VSLSFLLPPPPLLPPPSTTLPIQRVSAQSRSRRYRGRDATLPCLSQTFSVHVTWVFTLPVTVSVLRRILFSFFIYLPVTSPERLSLAWLQLSLPLLALMCLFLFLLPNPAFCACIWGRFPVEHVMCTKHNSWRDGFDEIGVKEATFR
jgi:hypothetical protein